MDGQGKAVRSQGKAVHGEGKDRGQYTVHNKEQGS